MGDSEPAARSGAWQRRGTSAPLWADEPTGSVLDTRRALSRITRSWYINSVLASYVNIRKIVIRSKFWIWNHQGIARMHLLCVVAEWTLAHEHKIDATPRRPEIYALIVHLSPTEDLWGPIDMRADSRREHLQASCFLCILIRRRFLLHTAQIQRLHDLCCRSRFFIFIFFFFIVVCLQLARRLLGDFLPDFALRKLFHG